MGWFVPVLAGVAVWQGSVMLCQSLDRKRKYEAAKEHAEGVNKPLLVVGGPFGATPWRSLLALPAHGAGDVCLDLEPAACEGSGEYVLADVRSIPFPDKYFGCVLASHILEHLPTAEDCQQAMRELTRVADAVYIAYPSKQSILAWLIPDHYLWLRQEGDVLVIEERGRAKRG